MNSALDELAAALADKGVQEDALLKALHLLRAPHNLVGIKWQSSRFLELTQKYHWLLEGLPISDLAGRLHVLRIIAESDLPVRFGINRKSHKPLRPCTGDSGLCDLLLMQPSVSASHLSEEFERLIGWYGWHLIQLQAGENGFADYLRYLQNDFLELRDLGLWNQRLYNAYLQVAHLMDERYMELLPELNDFLGMPSEKEAINIIRISRYQRLTKKGECENVLNDDLAHRASKKNLTDIVAPLALMLEAIWDPGSINYTKGGVEGRSIIARNVFKPRLELWKGIATVIHESPVQSDRGVIAEIHLPQVESDDADARSMSASDHQDDAEPDQYESAEPCIRLYLGHDDPVRDYYLSKAIAHHIERHNAWLRWSSRRLSIEAIRFLLKATPVNEQSKPVTYLAWLTIQLSLITGRKMEDVVVPLIYEGGVPHLTLAKPISIDLSSLQLHVLAGSPNLKGLNADRSLFHPHHSVLSLPLYPSWRPFLKHCYEIGNLGAGKILKEAKIILRTLPAHFAIDEDAIQRTLSFWLLDYSNGDRALIKVITDSNASGLPNLIHYSSWPRTQVTALWRGILEEWKPNEGLPTVSEQQDLYFVGSPHAFKSDQIKHRIEHLKESIRAAHARKDWTLTYNEITWYLMLWMNLATAGRASRNPIPRLIANDWFYVDDKRRPDGSTARLVPIDSDLRRQFAIWLQLKQRIELLNPSISESRHGMQMLCLIHEGQAVPFLPSMINAHPILKGMPANWARKLVRSWSGDLCGRFRDAGLGHFISGRHSWNYYSTLNVPQFCQDWCRMQSDIRQQLGFEVLALEDFDPVTDIRQIPLSKPAKRPKEQAEPVTNIDSVKIETLLAPYIKDQGVLKDEKLRAVCFHAAKEIVKEWVHQEFKNPRFEDQNLMDLSDIYKRVDGLCDYIRREYGVSLFRVRPLKRFSTSIVISADSFQSYVRSDGDWWARVQKDLSKLPVFDKEPGPWPLDRDPETGRLLMVMISRIGLLASDHIRTFLNWFAGSEPIKSIGTLRLIELHVRCVRTQQWMRRTVLLEPYASSYIVVHRPLLGDRIKSLMSKTTTKIMKDLNLAIHVYQKSLGIEHPLRLQELIDAARMRTALSSSPIVSAYASGVIYTQDLSDSELIRLAGFHGYKRSASTSNDWIGRHHHDADDEEEEIPIIEEGGIIDRIIQSKSANVQKWRNEIIAICPGRVQESVVYGFALYEIERLARGLDDGENLNGKNIQHITMAVRVIGCAMLHIAESVSDELLLDERAFQALYMSTDGLFKDRHRRESFNAFRRYLLAMMRDLSLIKNLGKDRGSRPMINIQVDDRDDEIDISAKILSRTEVQVIKDAIKDGHWFISGEQRETALRMMSLIETYGLRRFESGIVRTIDHQTDLIRLQPYEAFTLKTRNSERNLPAAFAQAELSGQIEVSKSKGYKKLSDAAADQTGNVIWVFNRMIEIFKDVTRDPSLALHHLRHTLTNVLLMSLLAKPSEIEGVTEELPWLSELLIDAERLRTLIGGDIHADHGLQAISSLLGHLHPSTTVRHYVHTLCVLHYAHLKQQCPTDILRAFENRCGSRSMRYLLKVGEIEARDHLEKLVRRKYPDHVGVDSSLVRVAARDPNGDQQDGSFFRISRIETAMMKGDQLPDVDLAQIKVRIEILGNIPSGKRGSILQRHPLSFVGRCQVKMPEPLRTRRERQLAAKLLAYIDYIEVTDRAAYLWLVKKWCYESNTRQGFIRISEEDRGVLKRISRKSGVEMSIRRLSVSKNRVATGAKETNTLRIGLKENGNKIAHQSSTAVRWALTWLVLLETDINIAQFK